MTLRKIPARLGAVLGVALISGFSFGAAPAMAQASADKMKAMFDAADTNHDGKITLAEWQAAGRRERGFNYIDANHDGAITLAEMQAAMAKFGH
ncbi:EF-hand domain-containing protein [Novosphingobium sp. 9]|uniref:EF-hand domain-containing protein n=1 Tax=Novosphingobium sp. 9 TaxID=2025349 RepID=UPI0021B506FF|nr:EF-hand domain-containing protein [Novosphingobium sp. 9]